LLIFSQLPEFILVLAMQNSFSSPGLELMHSSPPAAKEQKGINEKTKVNKKNFMNEV